MLQQTLCFYPLISSISVFMRLVSFSTSWFILHSVISRQHTLGVLMPFSLNIDARESMMEAMNQKVNGKKTTTFKGAERGQIAL